MRLFFVIILCVSTMVQADSWFEKAKAGYEKVKQQVTDTSVAEPQLALPTDMPASWHYHYIVETVFNSKVAVLETGKQHKQSIILVHGLGQLGMQDWYSVIPYLAQSYHVIAIDLPGFGYSAKPEGRYSPTNYAKVVRTVVDNLAQSKLVMMGHSMGGAVSVRFAAMYPKRLDKLVLVDVAGVLQKTAFMKSNADLTLNDDKVPEQLQSVVAKVNDFGGALIEMTSVNKVSDSIENSDLTWLLLAENTNLNAAMSLINEDFGQALTDITVDTQIIWGGQDRIAPMRTAKVLTHHIKNASLQVIESAAHVPMKSHQAEFIEKLSYALAPEATAIKSQPVVAKGDRELMCNQLDNQLYSGHFKKITLNNCSNIELKNVTTEQLEIIDSLVNIEDLTLYSNSNGLIAKESVITITNGQLTTQQPLLLSGSRLDVAGVKLVAPLHSMEISEDSKLVFSVSHIQDGFYQGFTHGAYKLSHQTIANKLMDKE